jgi:hypothetical protein
MRTSTYRPRSLPAYGQPQAFDASKTPRVRVFLVFGLAVLAYALVFTFWRVEPVPTRVHIAAVAVAATCLVPMALWYAHGRQGLPMFELICMSYALQFSMPVYTHANWIVIYSQIVPLPSSDLFEVLLFVEMGVVALMAGYYAAHQSGLLRRLPQIDLPMDPSRRWIYLLGALTLGGTIALLKATSWEPLESGALSAIVRLISTQLNLAIILLAYEVYGRPTRRMGTTLLLYLSVAVAFVIGLLTGLLENAFVPLLALFLVNWHARRRFPWLGLLLGIALYFILNPAKFEYRDQTWYSGNNPGLGQRLGLWTELVGDRANELLGANAVSNNEDNVRQALARFDLVHKFTWVRGLTPEVQPYYRGETYRYFLYAYIPRALWLGKPLASASGEQIDLDYRLKLEAQTSTIGIGLLPEAYANFGPLGILLILAVQGLIFALLDKMLNGPHSDGGRAIYLSVMIYFLNGIGSSAAVLFGAIVQQVVANALILRPFAHGFRTPKQDTLPTPGGAALPVGLHNSQPPGRETRMRNRR